MIQEEQYIIEKLYIMDVKTLLITEVTVSEVDACKFAIYYFMDRKCCYWLKGANIQTLSHVLGYTYPQYIVSKDKKSLYWLKESFQWLIGDIGFVLRDAWNKIYDEKFDDYKHIK
jgi:hypothetical protein